MNKAFKFRIYPTPEQIAYFDECVRTSNFIYNYSLKEQMDISKKMDEMGIVDKADRKKYMTDNDLYFNKYKMSKQLTQMSKTDEYAFLKIPPANMRAYSLKNIESAFKNIKKISSGFPKFKNKYSRYSYTAQIQNTAVLNVKNKFGYVTIPKVKNIKFSCHNPFFRDYYNIDEFIKINSYTISKNGDKFFISFQADVNDGTDALYKNREIKKETSIGIDLGVKRPVTTSNKDDFKNAQFATELNLIKQYKDEVHKLSAILNRKKEYHKKNKTGINFWETKSYIRIKNKLNDLHFKISEKRNFIQHNITKQLIDMNDVDTYIFEDLNVKGMTKRSAKGLSNKKSNLNRVINDVGFYALKNKLTYKAERIGKNVLSVAPNYTSQTCSACGHVDKKSRISQNKFVCTKCGYTENADFNAAVNIKNKYFDNISK